MKMSVAAALPAAAQMRDVPTAEVDTVTQVPFEVWLSEAGPDLSRFGRLLARSGEADDLVQDALVAVYLRWSRFDQDPAAAVVYARRTMINSRISRWRRWGSRVRVGEVADPVDGPANTADATEVLAVQNLLMSLPAVQRAAVFLRFYDDLSFTQIADVLGCREATARSHVHRALVRLRSTTDRSEDHRD